MVLVLFKNYQHQKLGSNCITSAKITNEAVQLEHLPHGTSSNDGKFLRANNGADPTFETVTGTTISGNADNRVITGSDTANTLNAEAGFTHNPATDDTQIITSNNLNVADLLVQHTGGGAAAVARLTLHAGSNANSGCQLGLIVGSHAWYLETPKNAGNLNFMKGAQKFRMGDDGDFYINDGDLVIGTAGHGIDFSADSNNGGATNELLDDYEYGSFTPSFNMTGGTPNITYHDQQGQYVKIGQLVQFQIYLRINTINSNSSGIMFIGGLPFTPTANTGQGPAMGGVALGYCAGLGNMNSRSAPVGYVEANYNRIYMYVGLDGSGNHQNMSVANNLSNTAQMRMMGTFQVE